MFLEALISFLLLLQVRRILQKNALHPQWQKYCLWGMVAIGILFVLQETFSTEDVSTWVWHIILLGITGFIMLRQEFQPLRGIVFSFLPLIIISVFRDVFGFSKSDWAATLVHYLDIVTPLAIIWLVVMLVIFNKQRRALEKERKIRLTEEEENKVIAARKAELEEMVKERTAELTKQKEELSSLKQQLFTLQNIQTGIAVLPATPQAPQAAIAEDDEVAEMNSSAKIKILVAVSGNKNIPIPVEQIACFYKSGNYTTLKTFQSETYLLNHSLDELARLLEATIFFRANRQFIININACHFFTNEENGKLAVHLTPAQDEEVIISQ
ncbi:MAG: LytTR family transcriptional regulator, partial [Bacteroidia bacterium]|nr:LytTR family transcriptional regulator [Bacteroidia bacterium]